MAILKQTNYEGNGCLLINALKNHRSLVLSLHILHYILLYSLCGKICVSSYLSVHGVQNVRTQ